MFSNVVGGEGEGGLAGMDYVSPHPNDVPQTRGHATATLGGSTPLEYWCLQHCNHGGSTVLTVATITCMVRMAIEQAPRPLV